jgi:hypothetical protein
MHKKTTVITMTGDRQLAFSRCEYYMSRQSVKPDQWVVVDDGLEPTKCSMGQHYVRRERKHNDPVHTLVPNLLAGLDVTAGDDIIIMEDDDWYAPNYLQKMLGLSCMFELYGEGNPTYYNIRTKQYYQHKVTHRTSLCSTGWNSSLTPTVRALCEDQSPFLDMRLWASKISKKVIVPDSPTCVGIKSMPGRAGIGSGHNPARYWANDPDWSELSRLVGKEDAEWYLNISNKYYGK